MQINVLQALILRSWNRIILVQKKDKTPASKSQKEY